MKILELEMEMSTYKQLGYISIGIFVLKTLLIYIDRSTFHVTVTLLVLSQNLMVSVCQYLANSSLDR